MVFNEIHLFPVHNIYDEQKSRESKLSLNEFCSQFYALDIETDPTVRFVWNLNNTICVDEQLLHWLDMDRSRFNDLLPPSAEITTNVAPNVSASDFEAALLKINTPGGLIFRNCFLMCESIKFLYTKYEVYFEQRQNERLRADNNTMSITINKMEQLMQMILSQIRIGSTHVDAVTNGSITEYKPIKYITKDDGNGQLATLQQFPNPSEDAILNTSVIIRKKAIPHTTHKNAHKRQLSLYSISKKQNKFYITHAQRIATYTAERKLFERYSDTVLLCRWSNVYVDVRKYLRRLFPKEIQILNNTIYFNESAKPNNWLISQIDNIIQHHN